MRFRNPLLALAFVASAALPSLATTYYVSPSGNDHSNGTSPNSAWATVAKVNTANLRPGDTVLFQSGGTWRETLYPQTWSLTISSYGTGKRPVISGANLLNGTWYPAGGPNQYAYAVSAQPTQVWFNGVLGTEVYSQVNVAAPLEWYYTVVNGAGRVIVYSPGYPNSSYNAPGIEVAQRNQALVLDYSPGTTIDNIAFVNSNSANVCLCSGNTGTQTFNNDVFSGSPNEAFSLVSGTAVINGSEFYNNGVGINNHGGGFILNDSIISGSYNQAVLMFGNANPSYIFSSTITGNSTHNPDAYTVSNLSSSSLDVNSSILLPAPWEPRIYGFYGLTNVGDTPGNPTPGLGNNVYESPAFASRPAPAIVVPFIDDYINLGVAEAVSAVAHQYGCNISYALNTKLLGASDWNAVSQLVASGDEIVAHTRSHSDLANNNVFSIQYTGPAATATMTINQTTGVLQTFLNGSTTPDLSLPTNNTYNGVIDILGMIPAGAPYTVNIQPNQNFFTPINLANVSKVNIKSAPYMTQAGPNYLNWEVQGSQTDIETNLPGYIPKAFATPFTSSSPAVENQVQGAGFKSMRNGLLTATLQPDGNWLLSNLDVYNMASLWLPFTFDTTNPVSSTAALVEGLGASGGVMAVYSHGYDEFSLQNWTDLFSNLKSLGATCMTMSQANAYIESHGSLIPDGQNKNWVANVPLFPSFAITPASPVQGARNLQ